MISRPLSLGRDGPCAFRLWSAEGAPVTAADFDRSLRASRAFP